MTTRRQFFAMSGLALAASALPAVAQARTPTRGDGVKITQIRNATLLMHYAGVRFLIDPMLSERHGWPGFAGTVNSEERNPLVHLPLPLDEILDVDAVIVTHLHEDHWDKAAQAAVPKGIPLFTQNEADAATVRSQGFTDVRILSETSEFNGVQLIKTKGRHGTEKAYQLIGDILGEVCGVVFRHADEKTVYLAGDTIWNADIASILDVYKPDVAILNAGYAEVIGIEGAIIMGTNDVLSVHRAAPDTVLFATHMEAVNHCTVTRAHLRAFARTEGFADTLLTPGDGETVIF